MLRKSAFEKKNRMQNSSESIELKFGYVGNVFGNVSDMGRRGILYINIIYITYNNIIIVVHDMVSSPRFMLAR